MVLAIVFTVQATLNVCDDDDDDDDMVAHPNSCCFTEQVSPVAVKLVQCEASRRPIIAGTVNFQPTTVQFIATTI